MCQMTICPRRRDAPYARRMSESRKTLLGGGEAVPWFRAPVARRFGLLCLRHGRRQGSADALLRLRRRRRRCKRRWPRWSAQRALFDDEKACFFGITVDPADAAEQRIRPLLPGLRFFLDYDRKVSAAFGAAPRRRALSRRIGCCSTGPCAVAGRFALEEGDAALAAAAALALAPPAQDWAPVVARARRVRAGALPPADRSLRGAMAARNSGFMRDVDGKTRLLLDPAHKIRRDWLIEDPALARELNLRLIHRLLPMVQPRLLSSTATRVERLLVGCYEAETRRPFPRPSRQHDQGHRASPLRGDDQSQRRGL